MTFGTVIAGIEVSAGEPLIDDTISAYPLYPARSPHVTHEGRLLNNVQTVASPPWHLKHPVFIVLCTPKDRGIRYQRFLRVLTLNSSSTDPSSS
jgi:hypothetical protein